MIYFKICEAIVLVLISCLLFYHVLNLYQQEHYDFSKLIHTFPKLYFKKLFMYVVYAMILFRHFPNVYHIILVLILGVVAFLYPTRYIIPLKFTKRMIRLIVTLTIVIASLFIFIPNYHFEVQLGITVLFPFILYFCNQINRPIEYWIKRHYIKLAKQKLKENDNLIKVAITGSYGKTTTKNILAHVLGDTYITIATPKSYNTLMGLCLTINQELKSNTEILIAEMGAFRIGEIKEMCNLVEPDISVITQVGPQHLSTFHTEENVLKAKLEIVHTLSFEKSVVFNGDNEQLYQSSPIHVKDVCYVGMQPHNTYQANNIKVKDGITTFQITNHQDIDLEIETSLLGEHNILNITLVYGIICALRNRNIEISNQEFQEKIKSMLPIPHRLEYHQYANYHIYDDSYSSNIKGFESAMNVLSKVDMPKVIITPGIVDGGKNSEKINTEIANIMVNTFDDIYLIQNQVISYITDVFKKHQKKYHIYASFKEAFEAFKQAYPKEEVSLLIENDLPDNFLER